MSLWPEDITSIEDKKVPVQFLKEQASYLSTSTDNMLVAMIKRIESHYGDFAYQFSIKAPVLNNYTYNLFSITHGIFMYPLDIHSEDEIINEIIDAFQEEKDINHSSLYGGSQIKLFTEEEFLIALKIILQSKITGNLMKSLLIQIKAN